MKKFLSLVLALVMAMSLVTISAGATEYKDLTDKSTITYTEAVAVMNKIGIISGYTDGSFKPTATLTRGAAAKIIAYLNLGTDAAASLTCDAAPYSDVKASDTFAPFIAYCKNAKLIDGYADGTFKAGNTLTGFQFAKMLLTSLGYKSDAEGFTGANWSVNVAKLASKNSLFKGNSAFVGSKVVTREEACLYALNTLKAIEVEYKTAGTTISIGGATIVTGGSTASYVENTGDNQTIKQDTYMQFAEDHFTNLRLLTESVVDSFARPAHKWTWKTATTIGTYADAPILTYTTGVKGSALLDAIKSAGYTVSDSTAISVYRNGGNTGAVAQQTIAHPSTYLSTTEANGGVSDVTIGGNGVALEIYANSDNQVNKIVAVVTYAGKITAITADNASTTATDERALSIDVYDSSDSPITSVTATPADTAGFDAIYASAVANKTYVLVTPNADNTSATKALTIAAPTVVSGIVSKVVSGSSAAVTVAGTAYSIANTATVVTGMSVNTTLNQTIYLDSYGYAIYATGTSADANANTIYVTAVYTGNTDWGTATMIQGVMPDGTTVTVEYDAHATGTGVVTSPAAGTAYQYTVSNNVYTLLNASGAYNTTGAIATGNTSITATAKYITMNTSHAVYFASNVNYIYMSGAKGTLAVTTKSGLQAATFADSNDFYVISKDVNDNYVISAVYVYGDAVSSTTSVMYIGTAFTNSNYTATMTSNDGKTTLYGYTAYVDGVKTTVYLTSKSSFDAGFYTYTVSTTTGAYTLTTLSSSTRVGTGDMTSMTYVNDSYYINGIDAIANFDATAATVVDLTGVSTDGTTYNTMAKLKNKGTASLAVVFDSDAKTVSTIYVLADA